MIDSADPELLDEVMRLAGGRLQRKTKAAEHHRQAWSWRLTGADAIIALLRELSPYMRCAAKAERARVLVDKWRIRTNRNGLYSDEQTAAKADFDARFLAVGSSRGSTILRAAA